MKKGKLTRRMFLQGAAAVGLTSTVGCPLLVPVGPTADFAADVTVGTAPLTVHFTDASTPGTAAITSWSWAFGDGAVSTDRNPDHQYTTAGTYTVTLTVTTSVAADGETKTDYVTVNPSQSSVKAYKRSSRGLHVSNAIRKHNANHLYANRLAALGDPAHPGDRSKVVSITISKAQFDRLFPEGKMVADLRRDL